MDQNIWTEILGVTERVQRCKLKDLEDSVVTRQMVEVFVNHPLSAHVVSEERQRRVEYLDQWLLKLGERTGKLGVCLQVLPQGHPGTQSSFAATGMLEVVHAQLSL